MDVGIPTAIQGYFAQTYRARLPSIAGKFKTPKGGKSGQPSKRKPPYHQIQARDNGQ